MEENKLRHSAKITADGLKGVKTSGMPNELQNKLAALFAVPPEESMESPFSLALNYVTENFIRQADGLRKISEVNDRDGQNNRTRDLRFRRKSILNNLQAALESGPYVDLERKQLEWLFDMASAFIMQISKEMGLFNSQHGLSPDNAAIQSNLATSELQQRLATLLISRRREATGLTSEEAPGDQGRFLEETVFPLFHTMSVRALGLTGGERLSNIIQNGVYGTAAAYFMYNDAAQNKFGKSFHVYFPSAYMDAFEQTDLLLVDDSGMTDDIRHEIKRALHLSTEGDNQALNKLSKEAKNHVYKVQVKTRLNGPDGLTNAEVEDRDKFLSSRCRSKGFDNADYLVLNARRAREVVAKARMEAVNAQS